MTQGNAGLVVVPDRQALGAGEPDQPGLFHSHHIHHRRRHDQVFVRTVHAVVHRAYGHRPGAGLAVRRDRQQRAGLGEVAGCRVPDRRRSHRHFDVACHKRVQARRHQALTTVFGDAGRCDRERHPGFGLVLDDLPVAVLDDLSRRYACHGLDVEYDSLRIESAEILVVHGRKRDPARAARLPGRYGQRAGGAYRVRAVRRVVVRVRLVECDGYRYFVGHGFGQIRDDLAGAALKHA